MTANDERGVLEAAEARQRHRAEQVRSTSAGAAAGVLFAVCAAAGMLQLAAFPSLGLSDAELTAWFDDSGNQAQLITGLNLAAVAAIMFLWFVAVIRYRLGDAEDKFFATVFLGSSLVFVGVWLTGAAALAAPAAAMTLADAGSVDAGSASYAGGLGSALILVVAPRVQAVVAFSTSTVILRSGAFPRWVGFVGYALALVMLVMPIVSRPIGALFPAWVLIVSIELLVHRGRITGGVGETTDPDGFEPGSAAPPT